MPNDMPECHHYIGSSYNDPEDLMLFVHHNCDNPAVVVCCSACWGHCMMTRLLFAQNFILDLKAHLLPCIAEIHGRLPGHNEAAQSLLVVGDPDCNGERQLAPSHMVIQNNHIYCHKTICVNFTTYDLHRETNVIKLKSDNCDILMLSPGGPDKHPFYYAHIIGIFHADVMYTGADSKDFQACHMEFLWVCWFEKLEQPSGWQQSSLDILKFVPMGAPGAFGFINLDDVLRACHLIPRFCTGRLCLDGTSVSRIVGDVDDWKNYYVNRWVAVLTRGHRITQSTTDLLIGIWYFIITGASQWVTCICTGARMVKLGWILVMVAAGGAQQHTPNLHQAMKSPMQNTLCYAKDKSSTKGRRPERSGQREVLTKRRNVLWDD